MCRSVALDPGVTLWLALLGQCIPRCELICPELLICPTCAHTWDLRICTHLYSSVLICPTCAQAMFGSLHDVEYWFEPCRRNDSGTRSAAKPSAQGSGLTSSDCAALVSAIVHCRMQPNEFEPLVRDRAAMTRGSHAWWPKHLASSIARLYMRMMSTCWAKHAAVKVVRMQQTPPPAGVHSILLVRHPADVVASRLTLPR